MALHHILSPSTGISSKLHFRKASSHGGVHPGSDGSAVLHFRHALGLHLPPACGHVLASRTRLGSGALRKHLLQNILSCMGCRFTARPVKIQAKAAGPQTKKTYNFCRMEDNLPLCSPAAQWLAVITSSTSKHQSSKSRADVKCERSWGSASALR